MPTDQRYALFAKEVLAEKVLVGWEGEGDCCVCFWAVLCGLEQMDFCTKSKVTK